MSNKKSASPDSIVREIKRKTRRKFTAEEKIRIILEGLKGEESIADIGAGGRLLHFDYSTVALAKNSPQSGRKNGGISRQIN